MPNRPLVHRKVVQISDSISTEGKAASNIWHRMKVSMTWKFFQTAVLYSMTLSVNKAALESVPAVDSGARTDQEILKWFIQQGRDVKTVVDTLESFPLLAVPPQHVNRVIIEAGHHRASAMDNVIKAAATKFNLSLEKTLIHNWVTRNEEVAGMSVSDVSTSTIPDNS